MKKAFALLAVALAFLNLATVSHAEGKDYHDQDLKGKNFSNAALDDADFTDAILTDAIFLSASLKKAIFKGAKLNSALFYKADLTGADLRGVAGFPYFSDANLTDANLEGVTFNPNTGCIFRGANLRKCKIKAIFGSCDYSGADLRGTNLRASTFTASDRFKGAIYDDDTAWPDGFDPKAAGAILKTGEKKPEAAAEDKK